MTTTDKETLVAEVNMDLASRSPQISPSMTECALNEWLDLVPTNMIIGFGGDVSVGPCKVYGALRHARLSENPKSIDGLAR